MNDYISLYIHGSEAYNQKDYKGVISYIEESLEDYLRGEEECRAFCEGPFDQGWFPDFVSSVATDETMLNNKEYYLKLPKVQDDYFEPREEAVQYVQRQEYEIQLLNFIETEFIFQDNKENEVDSNKNEADSS
ncbi:hypothetical protein C0J52_09523 [Blattella germanica]|nr:hypothetical protein C0J52_09523 [Blattella germanica]